MLTRKCQNLLSGRDRTIVTLIVLKAIVLIVCYTPGVITCVVSFCDVEFGVGGQYYNLCYNLWSFETLFEDINSSINIFLYMKMSTNYRRKFVECCGELHVCVFKNCRSVGQN